MTRTGASRLQAAPWPHGRGRPGPAGVASSLGFVLAVPMALAGAAGVAELAGGRPVPPLLACLACAAGLVAGGRRLLAGRGRRLLVGSAAGGALAAILAGVTDAELSADGVPGLVAWLFVVLPLPAAVVALAAARRVTGWLGGHPTRTPAPGTPPPGGWPADAWPYGPRRPDAATAAVVVACVLGGLVGHPVLATVLGGLVAGDAPPAGAGVALLCAAGLVTGAVLLSRQRTRVPLLAASAGSAASALVLAAVLLRTDLPSGALLVAVLGAGPAVAVAALALRPSVGAWLARR